MADSPAIRSNEDDTAKWVVPAAIGVGGLALIALAVLGALALLWALMTMFWEVPGVEEKQAPPTVVDMLPPPPPPPPPPPQQPQEKPPEPADQPAPVPDLAPAPDKPTPAPLQIDGPAQAGTDAYGVGAGSGGGMGSPGGTGTCIGPNCGGGGGPVGIDRFWGRNLANALERHIQSNKSVNVDSFVSEYDVWVNSAGALTQARLVKGSGNSRLDQTVLGLLQTATGLRPPPASIRMPQRIKVGRKRF